MRIELTPTFTSGKMKMMFHTIADCQQGLEDIMNESAKKQEPIKIKDILGRFTIYIIGSTAFGLECNSLKHPDAIFRKFDRRVFDMDYIERFKFLLTFFLPHDLLRFAKLKTTKNDVEEFFKSHTWHCELQRNEQYL